MKTRFTKRNIQILVFLMLGASNFVLAQNTVPSDPAMIEVSKNMIHFFDSIYQKKIIGAMRGIGQAPKVLELTGKYPAMVEEDLSGWKEEAWSPEYAERVQSHIDEVREIWYERKAIPGLCWHWGNPLTGKGNFDASQDKLTDDQFNKIVTPGTAEYELMMEDLRKHTDYLYQLTQENIPLIWRPLHEIDGGWFWWTDKNKPENTVKLWKIMYNYMVNERNMHNMIWVYCAALVNPEKASVEDRKKYYPGSEWCDMAGIDLYGVDYKDTGIKTFWNSTQTYQQGFDVMKSIAPDKLISLTETDALPNMDKTFDNDPAYAKWLWAMPWYCGGSNNPNEWVITTYSNQNLIMQPDLPDFATYKPNKVSTIGQSIVDVTIKTVSTNGAYQNVSFNWNGQEQIKIEIFNMNGQKELQFNLNENSVHTVSLKNGSYLVHSKGQKINNCQKYFVQ